MATPREIYGKDEFYDTQRRVQTLDHRLRVQPGDATSFSGTLQSDEAKNLGVYSVGAEKVHALIKTTGDVDVSVEHEGRDLNTRIRVNSREIVNSQGTLTLEKKLYGHGVRVKINNKSGGANDIGALVSAVL